MVKKSQKNNVANTVTEADKCSNKITFEGNEFYASEIVIANIITFIHPLAIATDFKQIYIYEFNFALICYIFPSSEFRYVKSTHSEQKPSRK